MKKRTAVKSRKAEPVQGKVKASPRMLDHLTPEESARVLAALLKRHPGLRVEAEEQAHGLLAEANIERIADDVYSKVVGLDVDEVYAHAGKHAWGYVEPGEAAIEALQNAAAEALADIKRRAELGEVEAAATMCCGMVLGLYRARNESKHDEVLGWAPEFPGEHAAYVLGELLEACPREKHREMRRGILDFAEEHTPDWSDWVRREFRAKR